MAKKASSKARKRNDAKPNGAGPEAPRLVKTPAAGGEFNVQWDRIQRMEDDVDEQHVNQLTDHVFSSVLSRFGWVRNDEGHLEKADAGEAA